MKNYRACILIPITLLLFLCGFLWFVHSPRQNLRSALGLNSLPLSVRIEEYHLDAWTDYIFAVVISVDPEDVEKLLSGRDFKKQPLSSGHLLVWISVVQDFETAEIYAWNRNGKDPEKFGATCVVTVNDSRDRMAVSFITD